MGSVTSMGPVESAVSVESVGFVRSAGSVDPLRSASFVGAMGMGVFGAVGSAGPRRL